MDKIQKIGVSGFVYNNGKTLVLRRSGKEAFLPGYYELPGGKVEFGESVENAVVREMQEETGALVEVIKPYSTFSYVSEDGNRHTIDIQFIVSMEDENNIRLSEAHDDYKWITADEVDRHLMTDEMKEAIKKGFNNIS